MISVSQQFLEDVYVNGNRHYAPIVTIALLNGTILNITENQIMSGGLTIEESVSRDFDIDMGNAPISKCTLLLNNIDGTLSDYDFIGGLVNVEISLPLTTGTTETFQRGRYIIDTASGDSVITLSCLDYMTKFDVDYSYSSLTYPATLYQILADACETCGVTLATTSFLNQNIKVQARPSDMTFREVIGHIAEIAGCNAFINPNGELELRWYNIGGLAVSKQEHLITEDGLIILTEDGENLVGEIATDEDLDGYEGLAFIRSLYSLTLGREDVQITGVKAAVADDTSLVSVYTYGTTDYAISIDNNPFITQANAQTIANRIGDKIVGMAWRKANMSHFSTPYLQAGDVALIEDAKGNEHHVIISSTTFKLQDKQSSVSAAADPMRKKAEPFSQQTQMLQRIDTALTQAVVFNKLTTDDGSSYAQSGDIEETPSLLRTMRSGLLTASSEEEDVPEGQGLILRDGKIYLNADFVKSGVFEGIEFRSEWSTDTITRWADGKEYIYRFILSSEGLSIELQAQDGSTSTMETFLGNILKPNVSYYGDVPIPFMPQLKIGSLWSEDTEDAHGYPISVDRLIYKTRNPYTLSTYTYSYTVAANGTLNVTATNLGVTATANYVPVAFSRIDTGNNNVVHRSENVEATGSTAMVALRNLASSSQSGTLTVVVFEMNISGEVE